MKITLKYILNINKDKDHFNILRQAMKGVMLSLRKLNHRDIGPGYMWERNKATGLLFAVWLSLLEISQNCFFFPPEQKS